MVDGITNLAKSVKLLAEPLLFDYQIILGAGQLPFQLLSLSLQLLQVPNAQL